jgi:7,8-dihydropterin-6-yl-methyl-4-(beta-D-ribofuranosyl)aminobenzene 5'-phosphate synthase
MGLTSLWEDWKMSEKLAPVKAKLTILVDNTIMELIPDSELVKRRSGPQKNFLAEHGFSALIETEEAKVLVDTGVTGIPMEHNLKLLGLTMDDIDVIVFSHGHNDHTGGLGKIQGRIIVHPDSFHERYLSPKEGVKFNLTSPAPDPEKHQIEFHTEPVKLANGVMTTGEVKRKHDWEELKVFKRKEGDALVEDKLKDDMGVVINTEKGLVVIQGCSHAGIINTVEAAKEVTGVDEVYCVIGGFHLIGPAEKKIDRTIEEFRKLNIKKVIPIHCSGFEAIKQVSLQMPEQFEYCTVGCEMAF